MIPTADEKSGIRPIPTVNLLARGRARRAAGVQSAHTLKVATDSMLPITSADLPHEMDGIPYHKTASAAAWRTCASWRTMGRYRYSMPRMGSAPQCVNQPCLQRV